MSAMEAAVEAAARAMRTTWVRRSDHFGVEDFDPYSLAARAALEAAAPYLQAEAWDEGNEAARDVSGAIANPYRALTAEGTGNGASGSVEP